VREDAPMDLEPLIRTGLAALLALPIGLEREMRGKAAGLRTHVVVATAASALGYVSLLAAPLSQSGSDGTRIAAQVVTGIGFMGAGVIYAAGGRVHGLTTAAALFSAAAVGLCTGLGQPALAASLVVVTVLFLWPVDRLSRLLLSGVARDERTLQLVLPDAEALGRAVAELARMGLSPHEMELTQLGDAIGMRLVLQARREETRRALEALSQIPGVAFAADEAFLSGD
jgi:putative Mg2+ transporter-C (MgtC) family protein